MSEVVTLERRGDVALIRVNNPPVNALSQAVRAGLASAVAELEQDADIKGAVLWCEGRTFIAGADIREFGQPPQAPHLPEVIDHMEMSAKPVVAAIHGTALGGGLEVALGCHYRVMDPKARIGLPEVTLGIIPGAGGTQRMPRLVGVEAAAEMITSGAPIGAQKALAIGAADAIAEGDLLDFCLDFLKARLDQEPPRLGPKPSPEVPSDSFFAEMEKKVAKKARGQMSPLRALEAIKVATEVDFDGGMAREREIFQELRVSQQSIALRHAFFAEREVAKVPEMKSGTPRTLESIAVIGGGTMGASIAVAMLTNGLKVTMLERDAESLERGVANVTGILNVGVKRGKMSETQRDALLSDSFSGAKEYSDIAQCDLVIEAVFEDMEVKKAVFKQLDAVMKPGAVLASNTSYLDINEIAAQTQRPEDVMGLHFFAPANLMRLLEIVVGDKTSADVVATGFALAKKTRKVGVRAGVCDGFIGNRILATYRRQTDYLVEDGASPYEVDTALRNFGLAMGPFEVSDLSGIDIGYFTRRRLDATRDPRERYVAVADRLYEAGRLGRKNGKGWYNHESGKQEEDPFTLQVVDEERAKKGITARKISEEEIQNRYMMAMINEAAKVLEEGIALRPLDVDQALLHGYGFPRWRGGPFCYADSLGIDKVVADIQSYAKEDPYFWEPAALLLEMAEKGETFADRNKAAAG
ncbi:3-hydroxyacyl-CoA dehydrogenase NAD-binding domain-containing protein [Rhodovibrionaceae bacterium A322]